MTTPNIEELIDRLYDWHNTSAEQNRLDMQKAADLLQSQAERIAELEANLRVAQMSTVDKCAEIYTLRAQLAESADLLQSQTNRIKELEQSLQTVPEIITGLFARAANMEKERDTLRAQLADAEFHTKQVERGLDKATAQLAAIRAQESVLVVEKEPDYWSGGHFHEGSKPHIKPTKVWCLPIGTQLFTRPMPAQDVTELVELLEFMWRDVSMNEYAFEKLEAALSKYKGAK